MTRTKDILWDLVNRELYHREVLPRHREVVEYYSVIGKDTNTQQDYQAVAIYRNGCFDTIINAEQA